MYIEYISFGILEHKKIYRDEYKDSISVYLVYLHSWCDISILGHCQFQMCYLETLHHA